MATSTSRKLCGHKSSVTSLDTKYNDCNQLLSGSEDQTVRLWDLRTMKTSHCYARCFGAPIESVFFSPKIEHMIYACSQREIFSFDMRKGSGLITTEATSRLEAASGDDEINAMDIHPKSEYIAVSDDSGVITVLPMTLQHTPTMVNEAGIRCKKLSRVHTAMIGCLTFKPNSNKEIVSGGFDCSVCSWDFSRGRPQGTNSFSSMSGIIAATDSTPSDPSDSTSLLSQMVNPPFVQALRYICKGKFIAAALGDGSVRLLRPNDCSVFYSTPAHKAMATSLHNAGNVLISAGADRQVKVWGIRPTTATATNASANISNKKTQSSKIKGGKKASETEEQSSLKDMEGLVELVESMSIDNYFKVNAITGSRQELELITNHIIVADTSPNISLYSFMP